MDSLAGAALHRKDIGGAQRLTHPGQKSGEECKGKSQLNWIPDKEVSKEETLA